MAKACHQPCYLLRMFVCCTHIFSIFISAGEPLETVLFFAAGEPLKTLPLETVLFFAAGDPLKTLFFIFPPVVFLVAESLSNTVHRFTEGNGHLVVFAAVLVLPRGDYQQLISSTTLYTFH